MCGVTVSVMRMSWRLTVLTTLLIPSAAVVKEPEPNGTVWRHVV